TAGPLPFRFRRHDELVDDDLGAVRKIAELRFPETEHVRVIERVAIIEPEHRGLREQAVINADTRLVGREMEQRHIRLAAFRVVNKRMAGAESATAAVLARESDRNAVEQKRAEGEGLGIMPFVGPTRLENLATPVEHVFLDLGNDLELFGHA